MTYYAHSKEGQPPEKWQTLEDHLRNTAKIAADFAKRFDSTDWAYNAAWLHDLGKADSAFQGYLMRENELDDSDYDFGTVNHSSAGAAFAEEKFGKFIGRVLAYLSAGHHAGLPDWDSSDTGSAALSVRMKEGKKNLSRIKDYADETLKHTRTVQRPPSFVKPENFHFWVRVLYSCLVDADYLDTEAFMGPEKFECRSTFTSLPELKIIFDKHMKSFTEFGQEDPS